MLFSSGYALEFASPNLQADREIVLAASAQSRGAALKFASRFLRNDRNFVLMAVTQYGAWASAMNKDHLSNDEKRLNREATLLMAKKFAGPFKPFSKQELSPHVADARERQRIKDAERRVRMRRKDEQAAEKRRTAEKRWDLIKLRRKTLRSRMENVTMSTSIIQAIARGFVQRMRFKIQLQHIQSKRAAQLIQSVWHRYTAVRKVLWLREVTKCGLKLKDAPIYVRGDRFVVFAAVSSDWRALMFASAFLKHQDAELRELSLLGEWIAGVEQVPLNIINAPSRIKSNFKIARTAVLNDWRAYEYISEKLQLNPDIVAAAMPELKYHWINKVKIDPYALEFTPRILKIDSDVIFAALSSGRWKDSHRGSPLQFVPRSIRSKIEFDYHVAEFKRAARIPGQIGLISRRHVH